MGELEQPKTYDDWLNDELGDIWGISWIKIANGLFKLKEEGVLPKNDYDQIVKHQKEAFDMAVYLNLQSLIRDFEDGFAQASNKELFYQLKYQEVDSKIKNNPQVANLANQGKKKFSTITGSEYLTIVNKYDAFQAGTIVRSFVNIHSTLAFADFQFYEYLTQFSAAKLNTAVHEDKVMGFRSDLSQDQINRLLEQLIELGYIDRVQDKLSFESVFKHEPVPSNFQRVTWLRGKTLWVYFIHELFSDQNHEFWSKALLLFDGEIAKNPAKSFHTYLGNRDQKPRGAKEIDVILTFEA